MNPFEAIFEEVYFSVIGWTLIHSVWQIMIISALVALALKFIPQRKAQKRYVVSMIGLLLILFSAIFTFDYLARQASQETKNHAHYIIGKTSKAIASIAPASPAQESIDSSASALVQPGILDKTLVYLENHLATIVNLWLLGVLFYLVKLIGSLWDLRNFHLQHRSTVPENLRAQVKAMTKEMGIYRPIKVMSSKLIQVPVTYGIVKPVILIPASMLTGISIRQLEAIIAHELAHIKRYDFLVNIIQRLMEMMFFYHPCFWWISEQLEKEREHACDDLAVQLGYSPRELATGLANLAEYSHQQSPSMTMAASGNKNPLLTRIQRIMNQNTSTKDKFSPLISATMILSLLLCGSLVLANNPSKKDAELTTQESVAPIKNSSTHYYTVKTITNHQPSNIITVDTTMVFIKKDSIPNEPMKTTTVYCSEDHKSNPMPVLELSPTPKFPNVPPMSVSPPASTLQVPTMNIAPMDIAEESLEMARIGSEISALSLTDSPEATEKIKSLEKTMDKMHAKIEEKAQKYELNMKEWEQQYELELKKWEVEMEQWQVQMEESQKEWQAKFEPLMKAFEKEMEVWEAQNEPKIKAYEAQMEAWQERQQEIEENRQP
ncbi:hypothetical protein GCM10007049_22290 [Echinicola pacifica]|uniref:Peptidase M56 domain-containing protein n=1 Tax=Echinicola pacifica TaxID=346377 RepID=A0A918Q0S0_9BACT|nr:M56 family metallopeptidase [Echinicola pacifica]GGZ28798.1 hypothetical protein GCM10007049_22290 [Echinicola pacifica]